MDAGRKPSLRSSPAPCEGVPGSNATVVEFQQEEALLQVHMGIPTSREMLRASSSLSSLASSKRLQNCGLYPFLPQQYLRDLRGYVGFVICNGETAMEDITV